MGSFWEERRRIVGRKLDCGDDVAERLAHEVIGAAIEVHRGLGPGLHELVYEKALSHELNLRGIPHDRQAPVPVHYKGVCVGEGFIDLLIDGRLVIELKAVEELHPVHFAQLRGYLLVSNRRLGLLINLNVPILQDGIKRVVNSRGRPTQI